MSKIYLVDTENTKSEAYEGVSALEKEDELVLFVTKNSNNISMEAAIDINNSKAKVKKIVGVTGVPNALDFQMTTYLGMIISKCKNTDKIYVVSADKGFELAIHFAKNHFDKKNVKNIKAIHNSLDKKDPVIKEELIRERLTGYQKEGNIKKLLNEYLSKENGNLEKIAKGINGKLYERLNGIL